MKKKQKKNLLRIIISALLLLIVELLELNDPYNFILYMVPYFIIGYDILIKAFKGIINKELFDENFLMCVATIGSICIGEYEESVAVMLFYQIGELFQSYAINKSRKNISELMDIRPDYANIYVNNELTKVDPNEVNIGSIITVKVGEKIPLDGIVIKGTSSLNVSALTGESLPRDIGEGNEVISGSINLTSPIEIKTTKSFGESTASKILDLVENASSKKSESENFITKFAKYYTPIVCYSAIALAIIPPLFLYLTGNDLDFSTWIYRSLSFLVISCPCALVISIPLSFFGGIGGASNAGILIKGSNYLEKLSKVKTIAFDKTGTITLGVFEVSDVHKNNTTIEEIIDYAAHAEAFSNHPIAQSIIRYYGKPISKERIQSIKESAGKGIEAIIDNKIIVVGNEKLLKEKNIEIVPCGHEHHETIVHVAIDNNYVGHIAIKDLLKPNSKRTISELKQIGIENTIMLTGDNKLIAQDVAKELGVDDIQYELLPSDKADRLTEIMNKTNNIVAFVGDGINDAPVIALSDVGISMGALGSDAAIEAADIVLMDDDPYNVVKAIKIARKCMKIVYENIYFAIIVKIICLILSAFGITNMWLAIFADTGVMVIAVLNAIRALNTKNI